jgi:hypothetical protein
MPTKTYRVEFSAPPAKIGVDARAIEQALVRLDKQVAKTRASLASIGGPVGGIKPPPPRSTR